MLIRYSHLLHVLLVQDLPHGQQLDDPPGALDFDELSRVVERRALLFGVAGVAEGDEEAALDFGELSRAAAVIAWRGAGGDRTFSRGAQFATFRAMGRTGAPGWRDHAHVGGPSRGPPSAGSGLRGA